MKKEIIKEVEIPHGVEVEIHGNILKVKGPEGENKKSFNIKGTKIIKKENKVVFENKKTTKNEKKLINSAAAHVKNMLNGVKQKFEYELKVCFSHFPISVEVKGKEVIIKNFLGERVPRKAILNEGVDVEVNKDIIKVTSIDKELAGQAAADLETATKIRNRDRRIFQDGIFIIKKTGKEI